MAQPPSVMLANCDAVTPYLCALLNCLALWCAFLHFTEQNFDPARRPSMSWPQVRHGSGA